jgi:hypothetical protein
VASVRKTPVPYVGVPQKPLPDVVVDVGAERAPVGEAKA